jgi:uncharacterized membrane protein
MESMTNWIETIGTTIDVFGIAVMVLGIILATGRYLLIRPANAYRRYRTELGQSLLLGLELLVAADIVKTVAVTPTLVSISVLGLLVVIRTFLSWTLTLEVEGRWPWQEEAGERGKVKEER